MNDLKLLQRLKGIKKMISINDYPLAYRFELLKVVNKIADTLKVEIPVQNDLTRTDNIH